MFSALRCVYRINMRVSLWPLTNLAGTFMVYDKVRMLPFFQSIVLE